MLSSRQTRLTILFYHHLIHLLWSFDFRITNNVSSANGQYILGTKLSLSELQKNCSLKNHLSSNDQSFDQAKYRKQMNELKQCLIIRCSSFLHKNLSVKMIIKFRKRGIHKPCEHGMGRGLAKCSMFILVNKTYIAKWSTKGRGVKNDQKTVHMVYGWPQI